MMNAEERQELWGKLINQVKELPYHDVERYEGEKWDDLVWDVQDLIINSGLWNWYESDQIMSLKTPDGSLEFNYHQEQYGGSPITAEQYVMVQAGVLQPDEDYKRYVESIKRKE